eukprot:XP_011666189.1 PREDICTED: uncharacterized protein LOC100891697 [Strongylocentrotus purpuratus]
MANNTRGSKVDAAQLVQSVLADIVGDDRFIDLVKNHIDSRLTEMQVTIDRQEARLIAMEQKAHKSECDLREAIDHQEAKIMDLQTGAQSASKKLETLVAASSRKDEQIKLLKRELNAQEQYSRRNCLRIFGIPERQDEVTDQAVIHLVNDSLGVCLEKHDIERSHRLRVLPKHPGKANSPAPIIVKFQSYRKRSEVLASRCKLAGTRKSIQEDLTKENVRLLKATRDSKEVKAAWTRDGRVIALVPATNGKELKRTINSLEDLNN